MIIETCRRRQACNANRDLWQRHRLLPLAWTLSVAADDLDLISDHSLSAVLHLELDVLDQESPDLVAESVCVERALYMGRCLFVSLVFSPPLRIVSLALYGLKAGQGSLASPTGRSYLERQARLHLLLQHVRDCAIEVGQDLHRQLGVDAGVRDEVIEGVCESGTDAAQRAAHVC